MIVAIIIADTYVLDHINGGSFDICLQNIQLHSIQTNSFW